MLLIMLSWDRFWLFNLFSFFPFPYTICLGEFVLKRLITLSLKPPESVYPKRHFVFLINWKTKFKILDLDFIFILFLPQYQKRNSNNWLQFSFLIHFCFEFLMPSFVFHFHKKKMENEIQFVFSFHEGIEKQIS